jgi:hypothetical protein
MLNITAQYSTTSHLNDRCLSAVLQVIFASAVRNPFSVTGNLGKVGHGIGIAPLQPAKDVSMVVDGATQSNESL